MTCLIFVRASAMLGCLHFPVCFILFVRTCHPRMLCASVFVWVLCFLSKKDSCSNALFHVSNITLWLQCPHDEGLQLLSILHTYMHFRFFFSCRHEGAAWLTSGRLRHVWSEGEIKESGSAAVWRCISRSCESEEWNSKKNKKERFIMFHLCGL